MHALGLLCGHALYWMRMHAENRQHSIRTGPGGTAVGTSAEASLHRNLVWAIMQVSNWHVLSSPQQCFVMLCGSLLAPLPGCRKASLDHTYTRMTHEELILSAWLV